ncbi:MAG: hypothetical protein WB014_09635 [Methanosarcina sp.]
MILNRKFLSFSEVTLLIFIWGSDSIVYNFWRGGTGQEKTEYRLTVAGGAGKSLRKILRKEGLSV